MRLYRLENKRYDLIRELQLLIAQNSKPEELSDSTINESSRARVRKYPLTWMLSGIRKGKIIVDTNQNPLHQKLMEIFYIEHDIKRERNLWIEKMLNRKVKGLRDRINALERSKKGMNERINYLIKKVKTLGGK